MLLIAAGQKGFQRQVADASYTVKDDIISILMQLQLLQLMLLFGTLSR